ncbi:MAG: DUF4136 domain-containing protein [Actinobacteria bacterium]|nr:DUF4136 domain-containing protein [Actinomycetota bacterium]
MMMRLRSIALVYGLTALAPGCSTISTTHDYDTTFDFSSLKYYAWIDGTGDIGIDDLNLRRVRAAVNRVLGAKGYVEAAENLDFLVAVHGGTRSRVSISERQYGRRGWYGSGGVDVYQYDEGMLSVDVVDARQNQLVWRGTATKVLARDPSPEKIEETINLAVDRILEKFPPPRGQTPMGSQGSSDIQGETVK